MSITKHDLDAMESVWSNGENPLDYIEARGKLDELRTEQPDILRACEDFAAATERVQRAILTAIPVE